MTNAERSKKTKAANDKPTCACGDTDAIWRDVDPCGGLRYYECDACARVRAVSVRGSAW